jgi:hypothetical protein
LTQISGECVQIFLIFLGLVGIHETLIYYDDPTGVFWRDYFFLLRGFLAHFIPTIPKLLNTWIPPVGLDMILKV